MINLELTPDFLLPNQYEYVSGSSRAMQRTRMLRLLGGGSICTDLPFSFTFLPMDCCLLLYSVRGGGRILCRGVSTAVTDGQLLFWDCRQAFSLQSLLLPWDFRLFFLDGADLELYTPYFQTSSPACCSVSAVSAIPHGMNRLLAIPSCVNEREQLQLHCVLTEILSEYCLSLLPQEPAPPSAAGPLAAVWDYLEHHFAEPFSLEKLETRFGISRYRLCREFAAAYGIPPQKYLTRKRLEESKKMLLTTEFSVSEISSMTGYENVNHFIHLFKKYVGLTPNAFRRRGREQQSASHCSAQ